MQKKGEFNPNRIKNFVYMMRCRTGEIYTGYTNNPCRRLKEHNAGTASRFTRSRRPVELVYLEGCRSTLQGLRREIEIKSYSRERKLEMCRKYADAGRDQRTGS